MTYDAAGVCPAHEECQFYREVSASAVLRIKYATMYPYCRHGKHASCMRWWLMEQGKPVPSDLLPDGAKDVFAAEARGRHAETPAKVLVVDDLLLFRKSLTSMVANACAAKCQVVEAPNAEEAFDLLTREPEGWGLIVTDFNMGAMSGYDLIVKARTNPALSGIPVIIFSSEQDEGVRAKCNAMPRVRWLPKHPNQEPFDEAWNALVVERMA